MIGITGSIDRLSRLALMIRASSKTDEVDRVRRWSQNQKPDGFDGVILAMINHRFSSETFDMAESLRVQLASSIVFRRNRLLYQARHEMKLRADRNEENYSQSAPTVPLNTTFQKALETVLEEQVEQLPNQENLPPQQSGRAAASSPHTHTATQRHRGKKLGAASTYSVNPHIAAQYPKLPPTEICELCGKAQPREVLKYEHLWRYDIDTASSFDPFV